MAYVHIMPQIQYLWLSQDPKVEKVPGWCKVELKKITFMQQSKLVKALEQLNAWELRHLDDFVHSPFFNKHQRVTQLFEMLIAAAPDHAGPEFDREVVFARLFDGEPFHEQRFKDLLSLAMKTLRSFWSHYHLRADELATGMALLEEMRDRDWESEFEKAGRQVEKLLGKSNEKMHIRRMKELALQESRINYQSTRHSRKVEDSLQVFSNHLDAYYLMAKLKYGVEMANRQNVLGQAFDFGLLEPVLDHLQNQPGLLEDNPDLRLYFLIYTFVRGEDHAAFERFIEELPAYGASFSQIERRELYTYAMNFCIQQFNKGRRDYLKTLLELYKLALGDDTLLEDGWLSHWNYKNIVSAGLKAGDFSWTADFIDQYKPKVPPGERKTPTPTTWLRSISSSKTIPTPCACCNTLSSRMYSTTWAPRSCCSNPSTSSARTRPWSTSATPSASTSSATKRSPSTTTRSITTW
jgi:hypothetical protein